MNNSSLPIEILESIIDDFILEYAYIARVRAFLPRWYLIPLLRVCRLWHAVTEKYLYRSIAVGSNMHNQGLSSKARRITVDVREFACYMSSIRSEAVKKLLRTF